MEVVMGAEKRLEKCQAALQERGVRDVKFFFGVVSEKGLSQLSTDVADALEAVVRAEYEPFGSLGDTVRAI
jgi:hypothetical protein